MGTTVNKIKFQLFNIIDVLPEGRQTIMMYSNSSREADKIADKICENQIFAISQGEVSVLTV